MKPTSMNRRVLLSIMALPTVCRTAHHLPLHPGPEHQARPLRAEHRGTTREDGCNGQGALAAPVTAYIYDWNMLPTGQLLWEKELMSYKKFPPLQRRRRITWLAY
jgi:hypothetical protein